MKRPVKPESVSPLIHVEMGHVTQVKRRVRHVQVIALVTKAKCATVGRAKTLQIAVMESVKPVITRTA